ncbi:endonuclease/exonuclease/phosphatase family protein [Novipirellula sp. SH528]|uniref:endonuclease/exonuclease/phosphatase family protein n=1 Tax=Novipirellula sp. SH528 TaxID=3454466 RepID=UPI003F9F5C49
MKRAVQIIAILYLLLLVFGAVVMQTSLNSYWLVTLFLFSPRWVVALPLLLLVPLTLFVRWRFAFVYFVHVAVILIPILGYQFPASMPIDAEEQFRLRVLTCNVGGGTIDDQQLIQLINDQRVDVMMLQECSQRAAESLFPKLGWNRRQVHNVAIGSSMELGDVTVLARQSKEQYAAVAGIECEVLCPDGERVSLVSLHLPTFRPALERLLRLDTKQGPTAMREQGELHRNVARQLSASISTLANSAIIAGDFNVPVESVYYRDYWGSHQNAFSVAGSGFGYTKHTRYHGVRIDHVLVNDHWQVISSVVGPDLGGDHRPVIVELAKGISP